MGTGNELVELKLYLIDDSNSIKIAWKYVHIIYYITLLTIIKTN